MQVCPEKRELQAEDADGNIEQWKHPGKCLETCPAVLGAPDRCRCPPLEKPGDQEKWAGEPEKSDHWYAGQGTSPVELEILFMSVSMLLVHTAPLCTFLMSSVKRTVFFLEIAGAEDVHPGA